MCRLKYTAVTVFLTALLATFALHVHAEEPQDYPVSIRGLVVSSGHRLLINDGVRDFILLGVDDSGFEGKVCEAFGVIGIVDGLPAIDVRTITIIADEYPDEDLVGMNGGLGTLYSNLCPSNMKMIASGVSRHHHV